ncbi:MAG TPA: tetratricopeptide repeat protein [Chthoniobacter sp.]|jgi:predicted O-linked N-acetylglucosamine transferase (SPINDLY family)
MSMTPLTIDQALRYAAERHAAGFLREAEGIYRQVLALEPGNVEARHLLGRVALDGGRMAEAALLIGEVVRAAPQEARYQISLSLLQRAQGDRSGAVASAEGAVRLAPGYAPAQLHLGLVLGEVSDLAGAEAAYRAAIRGAPGLAVAHNDLGILLEQMGRKDEAFAELQTAVELQPDYPDAQCNLGLLLTARGESGAAAGILQEVLRRRPGFVRAYRLLGIALRNLGRLDESLNALREAVRLEPRDALARNELGVTLWLCLQPDPAMDEWRTAIRLDPNLARAYHHLGVGCLSRNNTEEALACYQRLRELEPGNAWHHNNFGAALKYMGDLDGALASLRTAMELAPANSQIHSGYLCSMLFHPDFDAKEVLAECEAWNRQHAEQLRASPVAYKNTRDPLRRLRVGYVSPNFWAHVVGRNMLPLLQHHDRERFEIFCYADVRVTDDVTREFQRCADHWRDTLGLQDEELARLVQSDEIDILVGLNLHLANARLLAFAPHPAPVQVSFAGYPGTTGLHAMDYRLTDPYLDPPGENDGLYSEESMRLPHSFWCYAPREIVPVNELPALANGYVSFGCLNNSAKINDPVLELWARVLQAVPGSHLVTQAPEGWGRKHLTDLLQGYGIEASRLEFFPKVSHREYLESYQRIDMMLDTFPYNGHTTSLDALWMGVPVITLAGNHAVARAGVSQLSNVGLGELIADREDSYVEKAVELARDLDRLGGLRRTLRQRMEGSPLMDAVGFAKGIEGAYGVMWRRWCAGE